MATWFEAFQLGKEPVKPEMSLWPKPAGSFLLVYS